MADDKNATRTPLGASGEFCEVDTRLGECDELVNLFAAFDEVTASDELVDATLARISALTDAGECDGGADGAPLAEACNAAPAPAAGSSDIGSSAPSVAGSPTPSVAGSSAPSITAFAGEKGSGAKTGKTTRRAKWRAIRIAAIAACLAMALSGGIAYAIPTTYYDVSQNGTTVTLGVNCFGVTVSASADDAEGEAIVKAADLRNVPYEESLARAIEQLEERDPEAAIEYGPRGGEREVAQPQGEREQAQDGRESAQPQSDGSPEAPAQGGGNAFGDSDGPRGPDGLSGSDESSKPGGSSELGELDRPNGSGGLDGPGSSDAAESPARPNGAGDPDGLGDSGDPGD